MNTFYETATYLEDNFSKTAADNFVNNVFSKVEMLQKYPSSGRKAPKRKTIKFVLIDKNRRLYYRIDGSELVISSLFDTRQHLDKDVHQ